MGRTIRELSDARDPALAAAFTVITLPGSEDHWYCFEGRNPNRDPKDTIAGCSGVITDPTETPGGIMLAHLLRASAYHKMHDDDRALQDIDEAIKLNPRWASAFNHRSEVYAEKGQYDRAIEDFTQAINLYYTPNTRQNWSPVRSRHC